jgi:phospholipid/cholesterol/gamma-HCH transport system substrate-binding protein
MMSREFKAGIAVILAAGVLYWGIGFLKGSDLFKKGIDIFAVYDNTEGITKSQNVTINGFAVGKVSDVYFHPDNSGRIVVKMKITSDYPITANSLAEIRSADLLGAKEIALILEKGSVLIEKGDTLRASVEESISESINKEVLPVKLKAEKLLSSLDSTINILSGFLGGEMQSELRTSFSNVNRSVLNLSTITDELSAYMTDNRATISDTLAQSNAGAAIRSLSKTAQRLDALTGSIERGEGTLGKLVSNDSLYNEVNHAILSLDKLLEDIREHPGRYVEFSIFGGRDKEAKKDE